MTRQFVEPLLPQSRMASPIASDLLALSTTVPALPVVGSIAMAPQLLAHIGRAGGGACWPALNPDIPGASGGTQLPPPVFTPVAHWAKVPDDAIR